MYGGGGPLISGIELVMPPAEEPLSLDEAKRHLRIELNDEDQHIRGCLETARRKYERDTRRQLVTATWRLSIDRFPCGSPASDPWRAAIRLPRSPLASVAQIQYIDQNGALQTLDPTIYAVDTTVEPGAVRVAYGKLWPSVRNYPGAITITFTAGYGTASQVPEEHKSALKLLVSHYYEFREPIGTGTIYTELPIGLQAMIWANKVGEAA